MNKVFISGSITIKVLPQCVKESINKIIDKSMGILVGDADGVDSIVQDYCSQLGYSNVTVYSIYNQPRYKVREFGSKYIIPKSDSKKERELQQEKDAAMTIDADYSLVIWDGRSKGSYKNIIRAIDNNKKVKLYLVCEGRFQEQEKINKNEVEYIYRTNNGYSAAEIVEYLKNEGEEYLQDTRALNKLLLSLDVIKKEDSIYLPMPDYEYLFMIDEYRGKTKGIRFTNQFINWFEDKLKKIKPLEEQSLF